HRAWQASCPPRSLPGRYRGDRNRQSAPCHTSGRLFPRTGGLRAFGGARAALALWKIRELRSGLPRDLRSEASPAHCGPIVWFGRLPFLSSTRPRHVSNSRIPPLAKGGGNLAIGARPRTQIVGGKAHFGTQVAEFKAAAGPSSGPFK